MTSGLDFTNKEGKTIIPKQIDTNYKVHIKFPIMKKFWPLKE